MKIFLICPVRGLTRENQDGLMAYVAGLERAGHQVHWPPRDTNQDDAKGLRICADNCIAIGNSDQVHVWFDPASQGSLFDLGMAYALHKPIVCANAINPTPEKSFANVILALAALHAPVADRCSVEWNRPVGTLCKPHHCELDEGHDGPHQCDCGFTRRRMFRDEPEYFEAKDRKPTSERP